MEDIDDDFGDLYADVEVQVSSVIKQVSNSINHSLYIKERDNNNNDDEEMEEDSKQLDMETDKEYLEVMDNGSDDSEDELRILLNEEDCRNYPVVNDSNHVRDLGMGSDGEGGEDNDDELVVGMENDTRIVENGGVEHYFTGQSVVERGNGIKSSYEGTRYSPYKNVRPNETLFASNNGYNAKSNGAGTAVPFSSASGLGMALPVVSQGCEFFLPRYRTIFDVNIETFERKPWRYPGVDITNFFNFGLDEESWKDYCSQLDQFRQQATKVPIRGPNQAHGNEYVHESVAAKSVGGDVNSRNANGGVRQLDVPKGRAIQVEGGMGERQPTMDIRRPQDRDSGVVIQIPMQDSKELFPSSIKEEQNNSMEDGSDNGGSGLDDSRDGHPGEVTEAYGRSCDVNYAGPLQRFSVLPLCLDHDGQRNEILDADGCHPSRVTGYVSEEVIGAKKKTKEAKERVNEDPLKTEACVLEAEPSLNDHILCCSPLDFDSQSEASEDGDDIEMEDTKNLAKLPSLNSVTRLPGSAVPDFYQQKESRSNESKSEQHLRPQKDPKNMYLVQEEDNPPSRMKVRSVAELKNHSDVDEASPPSGRKGWCDRNYLTKVHAERKERKTCDDFNVGEDLSLYRETEISIGFRSGRVASKQVRSSYSGIIDRKAYPHTRDEFDPCLRRPYDERDDLFSKRHTCREDEVVERELYLREKGHNYRGIHGITHEERMQLSPDRSSLYRDKERRYHWQMRESDEENRFRKEMEIDDFAFEHRYEEEIYEEDYVRQVPYEDRESDYVQGKYERDGPYIAREIERCRRRERYSGGACFNLINSRDYGGVDEHWSYSDHESSRPYSHRKSHILKDRSYRYATSPGNDLSDSRRSDGRRVDNWRHIHDEKHSDSGWFGPNLNEYSDTDRAIYPDDPVHSDIRRHIWKSNSAMDNSTFREQSRGRLHDEEASFCTEMSSRDEYIHVNHDFSVGDMLNDQHRYERDRRIFRGEESRYSGINEAVLRYRDSVDLREEGRDLGINDEEAVLSYRNFSRDEMLNDRDPYERDRRIITREKSRDVGINDEAVLRYRDSVDLHIVGWKGKLSGRNTKPMAPWINSSRKYSNDHENGKEQRSYRNFNRHHQGKFVSPHFQKVESNYPGLYKESERLGESRLEHHASKGNEKLLDSRPVNHRRDAFSVLEEGPPLAVGHSETQKEIVSNGDAQKMSLEDSVKSDNQRILQTLAKMEKRRERFKESSTAKKEIDINSMPQSDIKLVEAGTEAKQERPTRKRRWGGN